jgi:FKBP-type peptidyl-prolyl cis-trans isomerase
MAVVAVVPLLLLLALLAHVSTTVRGAYGEEPHKMAWVYDRDDFFKDPANYETTRSGLKYAILPSDEGSTASGFPVRRGDTVMAMYKLYLNDAEKTHVYSQASPSEAFSVKVGAGSVIQGFDEALEKLTYGGRGRFFLPPTIAYGRRGQPSFSIPPGATLDYYLEVRDTFRQSNGL